MGILVNIVNGELSDAIDINQIITAYNAEHHADTVGNEHRDFITLGDDLTVDTERGIVANVFKGDASGFPVQIFWDPTLKQGGGAWSVDEGNGVPLELLTSSLLFSVSLFPDYGVKTILSGGAPTFSLGFDAIDRHNFIEFENTIDVTDQDGEITITQILPDDFEDVAFLTVWLKVSAAVNSSSVEVEILDTTGVTATLTLGGGVQNPTVWTAHTIKPNTALGTWTSGEVVTIKLKMTSSISESAFVGEVVWRLQ